MSSWNVVLAALAVVGLQMSPAPGAGTAAQGGASIKGRVVDAVTTAPLSGARVRLIGSSERATVLTDAAGSFVFEGLPAGGYSFALERNGYLSASWPESSGWVRRQNSRLMLSATDRVENFTLSIARGGVVAGRIMSATGEPLSGAHVWLMGPAPATSVRSGTTNDLGEYRLHDLPAGRWLLRAQLRTALNTASETPSPGPMPTYYPGTLDRTGAQELVVARGGDVTEANLRLVEGTPVQLDVTVTDTDGRRPDSAALSVFTAAEPNTPAFGGDLRNGTARMELSPGEYVLSVQAPSGQMNTKDSVVSDLIGMARVRLTSGAREAVTVVVGMNATASGRVIFEGDGPPTAAVTSDRLPMFAADGPTCRYGSPTVTPDWTFRIDSLAGTCRAGPRPLLATRWVLKSVILDGREVLDENVWFEPGRHYGDVRIVMATRSGQIRVRVTEPNGTPTGEYAAVAFPVDPRRWRGQRDVAAAAPLPASFIGTPDPSGTGGEPGRSLRILGLTSGSYNVIAVDDIEYTATRDPAVLEKLARYATRVAVPERGLIEVPLQRYLLSDVLR